MILDAKGHGDELTETKIHYFTFQYLLRQSPCELFTKLFPALADKYLKVIVLSRENPPPF